MSERADSTAARATIHAVTSGKGGVGKTFVAVNLASALAARGERVLVLDADLGLANIDVVLNIVPKLTLHDVFTGKVDLDEAILAAPGGFSVLLAGSGLIEYSRLTPEVRDQLIAVIDEVTPRFDHVLLDTGAGISDVVLHTVSMADKVIIVATPEPTSLTDAYATIKVLAGQQRRERVNLVVNQAGKPGDGRAVHAQLQTVVSKFVRTPDGKPVVLDLLGEVPVDPSVREAVLSRSLLVEAFPGSPAARAIHALAARLVR